MTRLISKITGQADIPKQARYARRCIRAFEDLHITQHDQISVDTQADPLFNNNFFDTGLDAAAAKQWQARLDTTQLVDLLNEDGQLFTAQEWHDTFHAMAPTRMRGKQRSHEWATARSGELATLSANLPTERLEMAAMDPYLVDGAYVGVFSDREASDLKYAQVHTADDGECTLHEVWIDLSGFPHLTGDTIYWPNKHVIEAALWITRKERYCAFRDNSNHEDEDEDEETRIAIAGLRGHVFPADEGWHPAAVSPFHDDGTTRKLSDLTIRNITRMNTNVKIDGARPNSEKAWEARFGRPLPWKSIWRSLNTELSDPTEEHPWFKLLHRGTYVRNRQSQAEASRRGTHRHLRGSRQHQRRRRRCLAGRQGGLFATAQGNLAKQPKASHAEPNVLCRRTCQHASQPSPLPSSLTCIDHSAGVPPASS